MKITVHIDDGILARAQELTGTTDINKLVDMGLVALAARESAARLAEFGGSVRRLKDIPRRRFGR
ncbi:MAG TPA: type II toxin-antitoxin system VapB family antitoxin [Phycisphaerae bacterium]|nr:type II toxin-antitoxin system VapB family antitoxin [Phycisphaerae bacterium]HQL71594.1 type II toxin-antitoxin system VapB family antitoxin [Phycisphaerae bacterium]